MSKPDVATNLDGQTVGSALNSYWRWLIEHRKQPPDLGIATAYFNPGGFDTLADVLESAGKVRLLLGAEPDANTELNQLRHLSAAHPSQQEQVRLASKLTDHHRQMAQDRDLVGFTRDADSTVQRLLAWLDSGQVDVKRLETKFLHGKAYLVESDHEGVLVGSSNMTRAGLNHNVELNLARYEPRPVEDVARWFQRLWDEAVDYDLAGLYQQRFAEFDPYLVYLRMLWEFLQDDMDEPEPSPNELDLTQFQKDGLYRAMKYLQRHNGVLIADGVGLGKTFLAGELIRQATYDRRQRVLLIAPAALRDGPWAQFLHDKKIGGIDVVSFEQLAADPKFGGTGNNALTYQPHEYAMVVIDEAHAYRNRDTKRAQALRRLLSGSPPKQVVLLTATPVNNSLWDLHTLLSLFIKNDAEFVTAGIPSLREHFSRAQALDPDSLSPDALFDVLNAVAVRRTRRFVKKSYPGETIRFGDVEQVITFPEPSLKRVDYDFDQVLPGFFSEFAHALGVNPEDDDNPLPTPDQFAYDDDRKLTLARYAPSAFLLEDDPDAYEIQAAGLLRSGLLKRFESSPYAFSRTCAKMARSHDEFLRALDDGLVLTGDALAAFTRTDSDDFDPDTIAGGGRREPAHKYDVRLLRSAVARDRDLLREFQAQADTIIRDNDPKLAALVDELAEIAKQAHDEGGPEATQRDRRKVLVFSYFADTIEWIAEHLRHATINDDRIAVYTDRWATVTGSDNKDKVVQQFAPVSTQAPAGTPDTYDLLLTTDVLAEGVNLQQSRHIINFDLPWNPMRIVQRHGRIDRIGSPHNRVYMRVFFPSDNLNELLGLEAAVQRKYKQAAKSIGVEGVVLPDQDTPTDVIYGETNEQIRRLFEEDNSLLNENEPGALSGEEFRHELAARLADPRWQNAITSLPWVAGSGRTTTGQPGFVFCARIGDHPKPHFRWVPITNGEIADNVTSHTLTCLAKAQCNDGTPRHLPDHYRDLAYAAWEATLHDIYDTWAYQSDPANTQVDIPKAMRDAIALLQSPASSGWRLAEIDRAVSILNGRYDHRTQMAFRAALDHDASDTCRINAVFTLIDELGLEPTPTPDPLPEITPDDIHLVCWLALVTDDDAEFGSQNREM